MSVGRHFILGFRGPTVPQWLKDFTARYGLGGVILFDYDVQTKAYKNNIDSKDQLKALCAELRALPSEPLIFIDQEGGKVRRLKEKLGFKPLPSHEEIAKLPREQRRSLLLESFKEMKRLGIDVDLTPVIDINYNAANPDIGAIGRSFSASALEVEENALIVNEIAGQAGLNLCLKHYPGLGGAKVNSHENLTDISDSITDEQLELFHRLGHKVRGNAILLSHGLVKQWEPELPVSISAKAISLLRKQVPEALLISDDLQMQGLQKLFSSEEATIQGMRHGLDMVILGNNLIDQQAICAGMAEGLLVASQKSAELKARLSASEKRIERYRTLARGGAGLL